MLTENEERLVVSEVIVVASGLERLDKVFVMHFLSELMGEF